MICSYIFSKLIKQNELTKVSGINAINATNTINMCAVHIDYLNRPECLEEEEFLTQWCSHLGIPLYIRRITEIQRKQAMDNNLRETYERYTRNVRYATYKYVWEHYLHNSSDAGVPLVILGHNKDDCIENIFTNITHQAKHDNLSGMSVYSEQDSIAFLRPLLNITKKEIYVFSRHYNIPHLHNSTPSWSMRGQIRDVIRPALENWDKSSITGLIELSNNMAELYQLMDIQIEELLRKCKCNENCTDNSTENCYGAWETRLELVQTSLLFWKGFLNKLTNIVPSMKSLKAFIEQLIQYKNKAYHINNILSVKLCDKLFIYIRPIKEVGTELDVEPGSVLYKVSIKF